MRKLFLFLFILTVILPAAFSAALAGEVPEPGGPLNALKLYPEYAMSADGTVWNRFVNVTGQERWRNSPVSGSCFGDTGHGYGRLVRLHNAAMLNPALPRSTHRDANGRLWCERFSNMGGRAFTSYSSMPLMVAPLKDSLTTYKRDGSTGTATFSRNSAAWYRNSSGIWTQALSGVPRFGYYKSGSEWVPGGILIEPSAINYALDSGTPATMSTQSLPTGSYTLWVEGTGSCAVTAKTAAGTGWGTATDGSPVTVNITGAGTATLTVSGALDRFQLENSLFPTSYIQTAGTPVTRSADILTLPRPSGFASKGAIAVNWTPLYYNRQITAGIVTGPNYTSEMLCSDYAGSTTCIKSNDGVNSCSAAAFTAPYVAYRAAIRWNAATTAYMANYVNGAQASTAAYKGSWRNSANTLQLGKNNAGFINGLEIYDTDPDPSGVLNW